LGGALQGHAMAYNHAAIRGGQLLPIRLGGSSERMALQLLCCPKVRTFIYPDKPSFGSVMLLEGRVDAHHFEVFRPPLSQPRTSN
jgi:hypothetical protein